MRVTISQKGFTLIEALIAFLILTIGLLGASLFHSSLLRESSESRYRQEALGIAEMELEKARYAVAQEATPANLSSVISSAISPEISTNSNLYTIELANVASGAGGLDDIVKFDLLVSWGSGDDAGSVSVTSYLAWSEEIAKEESGVDLAAAASDYEGSIPVPTGTLTAIERVVMDDTDLIDAGRIIASGSRLSVHKVDIDTTDEDDTKDDLVVAFKIDDNTYVRLAKLNSLDNELLMISGQIRNDLYTASPVVHQFGCAFDYSGSDARTVDMCDDDTDPTSPLVSGDEFIAPDDDFIDVGATGGANCLIYEFENEGPGNKQNYNGTKISVGKYGNYVCVMGTGWNGSITPRLKDDDDSATTAITGEICSPQLRAYKYRILNPDNPDTFESAWEGAATAEAKYSLVAATSVAGQSGLVRFYRDNDPDKSDEGVYWNDYFAHVPNYVIEPTKLFSEDGYSYELDYGLVNQPGDLGYQNFYLTTDSDCNSYLDLDVVAGETRLNTFFSETTGITNFLTVSASKGFPGWDYEPDGYDVRFYNDVPTIDANPNPVSSSYASFLLGYTLSKYSISGYVYIVSGSSLSYEGYEVGGNPEPTISISCSFDPNDTKSQGIFNGYKYSCGVPIGWSGYIFAYPKASNATPSVSGVVPADYNRSDACDYDGFTLGTVDYDIVSSDAEPSGALESLFQYYFEALGEPVSSGDPSFDYSGLYYYTPEFNSVSTSVESVNLYFGENNCP